MYKQSKNRGKKIFFVGIIIVLAVAAVLYVLWHNNRKQTLVTNQSNHTTVKGTPSTPTQHNATPNNSTGQGGVIDQKGQTSGSLPPASQWVSSSSGNITLQQPVSSSVVHSGDTLSGLAKVNDIQFILKDDAVGLIAQGNLSVVNGKFSGTLMFTPHAKTGKLEVYYPNPKNGAEEDIIDIDVSFSP